MDKKPERAKKQKKKTYIQFSKILAGFISLTMVPFSFYVIWRCLTLAELAITENYLGALPYLTAVVGCVEAAITAVLGFYFSNSKAEKVANAQYGKREQDQTKRDF